MSRRLQRLNGLLRQELAELILREVKDPRVSELVTITSVDVSPDLKLANVYISVIGNEGEKASSLAGLNAAAAFLRYELSNRIVIRRVPSLTFILDESIEEATHILEIMEGLTSNSSDPPP